MSDRLAISASFSVLMMALYVLFGAQSARVPFGPQEMREPASIAAPLSVSGTASTGQQRLLPGLLD